MADVLAEMKYALLQQMSANMEAARRALEIRREEIQAALGHPPPAPEIPSLAELKEINPPLMEEAWQSFDRLVDEWLRTDWNDVHLANGVLGDLADLFRRVLVWAAGQEALLQGVREIEQR